MDPESTPNPLVPYGDLNEADPPKEVLQLIKFGGLNPLDKIRKFFTQEQFEALFGGVSGIFKEPLIQLPKWAHEASAQFFKYYDCDKLDPMNSSEDFGVLIKLGEEYLRAPFPPVNPFNKFMNQFAKLAMKLCLNFLFEPLSDADKVAFYKGKLRGAEILKKFQGEADLTMMRRPKIYIAIAILWRKFEKFSSRAEAIRYLKENKMVSEDTSDRELYQIFDIIGYELPKGQAGRPRKNTVIEELPKSGFSPNP